MIQRAKNVQDEVTFLRERISFLKNIITAVTKVSQIEFNLIEIQLPKAESLN